MRTAAAHKSRLISGVSRLFSLARNTAGNVTIMTTLAFVPFAMAVSAAVDLANAVRIKASLQAAADAGVLAAATALASGYGDSDKKKIAEDTFYANLSPQLLASFPATPKVTIDFPKQQVRMDVVVDTKPLLTNFLTDSLQLGVDATAMVDQGSPVCLMALNPSAWKALDIQGTAEVQASACAVHVNSSHNEAMRQTGSSQATAASFCVYGNYSGSNYSPTPRRYCNREKDPLAEKFAADLAATDLTKCRPSYEKRVQNNENVVFSPGVYCSGLVVQQGTVTLNSGIHVFRDYEIYVSAQGKLIGDGVAIILTGGTGTRFANQAGAHIDISAPQTGPFAGIVLAQDPASIPSKPNQVIGGGYMRFNGIFYFPTQPLVVTGNGVIGADSPQFAIMADTISVEGNGVLTIKIGADYAAAGLPKLPEANEVVRLVQ